jgi:hypothetical protein
MNYTLTYSQQVDGWVSFYSFDPDYMIGMNNYFYTFKGGNLYRHNTNDIRNTFYVPWFEAIGAPDSAYYPSTIRSVFNISPTENKLFKTINLEGDDAWEAQLATDIQSGFINDFYFEKKEGAFFAFIRGDGLGDLRSRSTNGIGKSDYVTIQAGVENVINFSIGPLVSVGNVSIGDTVYFSLPPYTTIQKCGYVTEINIDYPNNVNNIVANFDDAGGDPIPIQDAYIMYIKNSVAESHGVLGHYCVFDIQNNSTSKVELFTVESEVMKSFP